MLSHLLLVVLHAIHLGYFNLLNYAGLFLRRKILAFDRLSFSQVTKLYNYFKEYYEVLHVPELADESDNFGGSLIDSITSQPRGGCRLTLSGLGKSLDPNNPAAG